MKIIRSLDRPHGKTHVLFQRPRAKEGRVEPHTAILGKQSEAQQIGQMSPRHNAGTDFLEDPLGNIHVVGKVLVRDDDDLVTASISAYGVDAGANDLRRVFLTLPPAHPDLALESGVEWWKRRPVVIRSVIIAKASFQVLEDRLVFAQQALPHLRGLFVAIATHDLNVELRTKRIDRFGP